MLARPHCIRPFRAGETPAPQRLSQSRHVDGHAVAAVAQVTVNLRVEFVADQPGRTVAEGHLETGGVGAAEVRSVIDAAGVADRRVGRVGPAAIVPVVARVHRIVVAHRHTVVVGVRAEILLAEHVGAGGAVADVPQFHAAAQVRNARVVGIILRRPKN